MKAKVFFVFFGISLVAGASLLGASVTTGAPAEPSRYQIQYGGAPARGPVADMAARRSVYFHGHMDRIASQLDLSHEQQVHWASFVDETWVVLMSHKSQPGPSFQPGLIGRLEMRMWQAESHLERLSLFRAAAMRMYGVLDGKQSALLDRELLFLMDPEEKAMAAQ